MTTRRTFMTQVGLVTAMVTGWIGRSLSAQQPSIVSNLSITTDRRVGYDTFAFFENVTSEFIDDDGTRTSAIIMGWNATFAGKNYGSRIHIDRGDLPLTAQARCEAQQILALQANLVLQEIALKKVVVCEARAAEDEAESYAERFQTVG